MRYNTCLLKNAFWLTLTLSGSLSSISDQNLKRFYYKKGLVETITKDVILCIEFAANLEKES